MFFQCGIDVDYNQKTYGATKDSFLLMKRERNEIDSKIIKLVNYHRLGPGSETDQEWMDETILIQPVVSISVGRRQQKMTLGKY